MTEIAAAYRAGATINIFCRDPRHPLDVLDFTYNKSADNVIGASMGHPEIPAADVRKDEGSRQPPGPRLLVMCFIFADQRLLLLKRGTPPYIGAWAPPGGFVEPGESLESAMIREAREEVSLSLDAKSLIPWGIVSLPAINQVYIHFVVRLTTIPTIAANPPEALEARWFSRDEFPMPDIWEPFHQNSMQSLFSRVSDPKLWIYQECELYARVIGELESIKYVGPRSEPDGE